MNLNVKLFLAIAGLILLPTLHVQAVPMSGTFSFEGTAHLDGSTAGTSTGVQKWGAAKVDSGTLTFAGLTGQPVTLTAPWAFNSGPLYNFWQFGGFQFNLGSSAAFDDSTGYLIIILMGNVTGHSYDTTPYVGRFSIEDSPTANGDFRYTGTLQYATAPDGGATVLLLGLTFCLLAFIRRQWPVAG